MFMPNFASFLADATPPEAWYFKLASFAGGIVATFLGFLLNQSYQNYKDKIKEIKEYVVSLQSTANELEFYGIKLKQISDELENLANILSRRDTNWDIPTYSIYPNLLEKCKIAINAFHKNPDLVKKIGNCHFELCHISARLDLHKEQMSEPLQAGLLRNSHLAIHLTNVNRFKGLVDSNIPVFKTTCEAITVEIIKMEGSIQLLKERGPFSSLAE